MKKKLLFTLLLTIVMTMCFGMTAFASPKTMPDGTVFDAEYYAKTYPDVASAIGTDENALYQHYATMGKAEGRKPIADAQPAETVTSVPHLDEVLAKTQLFFDNGGGLTANENDHYNNSDIILLEGIIETSVNSYIEPILEVCARNGFKDLVKADRTLHPELFSPDNVFQCNYLLVDEPLIFSNVDYDPNDGAAKAISIMVSQNLKDYTVPGYYMMGVYFPPEEQKKNDTRITIRAKSNYRYGGLKYIREIPVN